MGLAWRVINFLRIQFPTLKLVSIWSIRRKFCKRNWLWIMGFSSAVENLIHDCWSKNQREASAHLSRLLRLKTPHTPSLLQGEKGAETQPDHSLVLKMVLASPGQGLLGCQSLSAGLVLSWGHPAGRCNSLTLADHVSFCLQRCKYKIKEF